MHNRDRKRASKCVHFDVKLIATNCSCFCFCFMDCYKHTGPLDIKGTYDSAQVISNEINIVNNMDVEI